MNEQYSARLTQWLDRLNHFDMTLKYTAGKKKFTNFIRRNPTENGELERNYEDDQRHCFGGSSQANTEKLKDRARTRKSSDSRRDTRISYAALEIVLSQRLFCSRTV